MLRCRKHTLVLDKKSIKDIKKINVLLIKIMINCIIKTIGNTIIVVDARNKYRFVFL